MINGTCFIKDLATQCKVGCTTTERKALQPILIDVHCNVDMTKAVLSDRRRDCVDYCELRRVALTCAKQTSYRLLERLAHDIATQLLALPHVLSSTVEIRKPHKLLGCREVGIALTLKKTS